MKVLRAVGTALTGALVAVLAAVPAQADEAEVWAFAYVDQLGQQEPRPYGLVDWKASNDVEVEVTHVSTGTFTVHLENGRHDDGVPMVTAANAGPVHCQVASYGPDDDDEDIAVMCYEGTVLTNSGFRLSFFASTDEDRLAGAYGYVRNDRPTETSYTNPPHYNSTDEDVTIKRAKDGIWTVYFEGEGFANSGGNVQVTALGTTPARCSVVDWKDSDAVTGVEVRVRCDNLGGSTVPPQWIVAYAHERSLVGNRADFFGYLQANEPASPIGEAYIPTRARNLAPNAESHRVIHSATGRYVARVYGPLKEPVGLHVSINGNHDGFCVITDMAPTSDAEWAARVHIACYVRGQLTDSRFTLNYYAP